MSFTAHASALLDSKIPHQKPRACRSSPSRRILKVTRTANREKKAIYHAIRKRIDGPQTISKLAPRHRNIGEAVLKILSSEGYYLDAQVDIEPTMTGCTIVLHANGGASRGQPAQNPDYISTFETILTRLRSLDAQIEGIWVDSKAVKHLPLEERQVRPGDHKLPIKLSEIKAIRSFRLEIRRSVSRVGGTRTNSIGTGNKRLRLSVLLENVHSNVILNRLIHGSTSPSGYWIEARTELPPGICQDRQLPSGLQIREGHMIMQVKTPFPKKSESSLPTLKFDFWFVKSTAEKDSEGKSAITLSRLTEQIETWKATGRLERALQTLSACPSGQWIPASESILEDILSATGGSLEDLSSPIDDQIIPPQTAVSKNILFAAPLVRNRVSRYIERGRAGDIVKAASEFCCQICQSLGLDGKGFLKTDGTYYVEAHHVVPVSSLATDVLGPANVICVCPNHHRQLHYGGVDAIDEGEYFRFDFRLDSRSIRVKKFSHSADESNRRHTYNGSNSSKS